MVSFTLIRLFVYSYTFVYLVILFSFIHKIIYSVFFLLVFTFFYSVILFSFIGIPWYIRLCFSRLFYTFAYSHSFVHSYSFFHFSRQIGSGFYCRTKQAVVFLYATMKYFASKFSYIIIKT